MFWPFWQAVCALALQCGVGETKVNLSGRCSIYRGFYTLQQADGTYPGIVFSSLAHTFVGVCGWKHFLFWLIPVKMLKCCRGRCHSWWAACGFLSISATVGQFTMCQTLRIDRVPVKL